LAGCGAFVLGENLLPVGSAPNYTSGKPILSSAFSIASDPKLQQTTQISGNKKAH
jgi:hypothetical protein